MHCEEPATADTAWVQAFPALVCEQRLLLNREWSLSGPEHPVNYLAIFCFARIGARNMHIPPSARQLGIDHAERPHCLGSHQHVADTGHVLTLFHLIELILQAPPARGFGTMLCLVDNDGDGFALEKRRFHGFPHLSRRDAGSFPIDTGVLQPAQDGPVVRLPVKTAGIGSGCRHAGERHEARILVHLRSRLVQPALF